MNRKASVCLAPLKRLIPGHFSNPIVCLGGVWVFHAGSRWRMRMRWGLVGDETEMFRILPRSSSPVLSPTQCRPCNAVTYLVTTQATHHPSFL
uniref:Uncharacterized protein n=1 Tax=Anguilla anguilla TaxID=7936 RepID=A0A0E9X534_ANGAN